MDSAPLRESDLERKQKLQGINKMRVKTGLILRKNN